MRGGAVPEPGECGDQAEVNEEGVGGDDERAKGKGGEHCGNHTK